MSAADRHGQDRAIPPLMSTSAAWRPTKCGHMYSRVVDIEDNGLYVGKIMATTTSVAPLVARLKAEAHDVYLGLEVQTVIGKVFSLCLCIVLHALVHVCEELDARAAAVEARRGGVARTRVVAPSPLDREGRGEGCDSDPDLRVLPFAYVRASRCVTHGCDADPRIGGSPLTHTLSLEGRRRRTSQVEKSGPGVSAHARLFCYDVVIY